jgi:nitronate monooxygenase
MIEASLRTPLCDLLECRYPVLQAGMGGVARSELVAAVAAAGGFGSLGMVREQPELIAQEIAAVRERTDCSFGVNLIPAATDRRLFDEELAVCTEEKVHAITFFWDVFPEAIAAARAQGCKVLYQVGSVSDALEAQAAGADAVIAQGVEAGGHVRGSVTSLVLLPLIARAVGIPVVASGGFASGASLVAALALGAAGIHCGTAFLATHESFAHEMHKSRILYASAEQTVHTDAFGINWPPNSPVRVLESSVTESLDGNLFGHRPDRTSRAIIASEDGRDIYLFSTDSPLRSMTGDLERLALFAGQVAGQIDCIQSAGHVIAGIVREAHAVISGIGEIDAPAKNDS